MDTLSKDDVNKIEKIYDKISTDSEFEIMFYNKDTKEHLNYKDYLNVLKYISYKSKTNKLEYITSHTLDIIYSMGDIKYRISVETLDKINSISDSMYQKKNHIIFQLLLTKYSTEIDKNIKLIKKTKEEVEDIIDYNLRVRLSTENDIVQKDLNDISTLDETNRFDIIFRYKERTTLKLIDDKNIQLNIDLTSTKTSKVLSKIQEQVPNYELEVELLKKSNTKISKEYLNNMFSEIFNLKKVIQQTPYIISKTEQNEVLDYCIKLLDIKSNIFKLPAKQQVSLEIQHVTDKLPNNYSVTDKADGYRHFMVIYKNKVYLISNNLLVTYTGINNIKYDDTIMDGELIYIKKSRKYLMLLFDILYYKNKDIRPESLLSKRFEYIDELIMNVFTKKKKVEYKDKYDIKKIVDYHSKNITEYMEDINNELEKSKNMYIIRRKYFIMPYGGNNNEIFVYSKLMWEKYLYDKNISCPYELDGLIYQPLDQDYNTNMEKVKFIEYKWKPENLNSIDFYVTFERDSKTNNVLIMYDNTNKEEDKDKMYKICHLHVYKSNKYGDQPVPFLANENKHLAYLYLKDGEVRDEEDNIIKDNTVVEFYYNYDQNIDEQFRWVPIRTRLDKTHTVLKYKKQYGNYYDVAMKVWRSITNPIRMTDISTLSDEKKYDEHLLKLRSRISSKIIALENKSSYWQKKTKIADAQRAFTLYIKDNLILTYLSPNPYTNENYSVLDIGCGQGGDLMKFWYAKVKEYVGVDPDNNALTAATNGAISRYNRFRNKNTNFPPMSFINMDPQIFFNKEDQEKKILNMSKINKTLLDKYFSKKSDYYQQFDRINCNLAIHYNLGSETVWNNFMNNINTFLKPGGYMLITTYDGDLIDKSFEDKDTKSIYYTDKFGKETLFHEIKKKYKKVDEKGLGYGIDMFNSIFMEEGSYYTEYLVFKDFLINEFKKKCNMHIVETDLFVNVYNNHKDFLENMKNSAVDERDRKRYGEIYNFYNLKEPINKASFEDFKMFRYYVFKKDDNAPNKFFKPGKKAYEKVKKQMRKIEGGGSSKVKNFKIKYEKKESDISLEYLKDILGSSSFIKKNISNSTLAGSIINVLNNTFNENISNQILENKNIDLNNLENISKNIKLKNYKINGLNIFVITEDDFNIKNIYNYLSDKNHTIILHKVNDTYCPIYKVDKKNNTYKGIFKSKKGFIQKLLKNNDEDDFV